MLRMNRILLYGVPAILTVLAFSLIGRGVLQAQEDETLALPKELSQREVTFHVLNRLAFGPQPGQVDEVLRKGWQLWIMEQLEPDQIDDGKLEAEIRKRFPSMRMSMGEVLQEYRPRYKNRPPSRQEQRLRNQMRGKVRNELRYAVLLRAVKSRRQFQEVMVEFWRNHFNVDQSKDQVSYLANHYEEHVLRKHVFGRFGDMLMASAKHPAMLIYLDNSLSQRPPTKQEQKAMDQAKKKGKSSPYLKKLSRQRGLNENYARELFELHTFGVAQENRSGGYTQKDIVELARALTGWTVTYGQNADYGFQFSKKVHDDRPKKIMGRRFSGRDGIREGEVLIQGLANHRNTALFISKKLCKYLVNDRPSEELVQNVAKVFLKSKGDLKKVYSAILFSPDFLKRENFRAKFKTPFEFAVSAMRATGADLVDPKDTDKMLGSMGQKIYQCDDPTGYYDVAEAWLDPGVLVHRWTFALTVAGGRARGVVMPRDYYLPILGLQPKAMKARLIDTILPGGVDLRTDRVLEQAIQVDAKNRRALASKILGMLLGSPTFQQQ
ncbi:MAG: DUF1800 domain-containing protein [Planctomycetota bacterium]|jgi:uncharacterized protein (DUF1800 family)|nr:DUF1800 domain-containing protein [Planctomycetota bacterium]